MRRTSARRRSSWSRASGRPAGRRRPEAHHDPGRGAGAGADLLVVGRPDHRRRRPGRRRRPPSRQAPRRPRDAPEVKICGVNDAARFEPAVSLGADYVGFVFYPPSPALVDPAQARELVGGRARRGRDGRAVRRPGDALIEALLPAVPLDVLQLHGDETPERAAAIAPASAAGDEGAPASRARRPGAAGGIRRCRRPLPARRQAAAGSPACPAAMPAFDWRLVAGAASGAPGCWRAGLTPATWRRPLAPTRRAGGGRVLRRRERARGSRTRTRLEAFFAAVRRA